MADINGVIAAYESQMQRAFHQGSRGIATTEQRAAWRREAVAAIDAVADRAWHEGYVAACEHYARAVLAPIPPQRCAPTEAEVSDALSESRWRGLGGMTEKQACDYMARAILDLLAAQPTVAQVKAEAVREAVKAIRGAWDDSWNLRDPEDPETGYSVDVWLSKYADRIERGE